MEQNKRRVSDVNSIGLDHISVRMEMCTLFQGNGRIPEIM